MNKQFLIFAICCLTICTSHASLQYPKLFLSTSDYQRLGIGAKVKYLKEAKRNLALLEQDTNLGRIIVQLEKDQFPNSERSRLSFFIQDANATFEGCMIGGREVPFIAGKCSTRGSPCTNSTVRDGFSCGTIFGFTCVNRNPIGSISVRCSESSSQDSDYIKDTAEMEKEYNSLCLSEKKLVNKVACSQYKSKMNLLNNKTLEKPLDDKSSLPPNNDFTNNSQAQPSGSDGSEASERCLQKVSKFEAAMNGTLESDQYSFATANRESIEIWKKFTALKKKCSTEICFNILNGSVFVNEMDPETHDSTAGIGYGLTQDIRILGETLALAKRKPIAERKEADLNSLIQKMKWWTNDGRFAKSLKRAYLTDETFSNQGNPRSLLELTLQLGKGRFFLNDDSYSTALKNGVKNLTSESRRIEDYYLDPRSEPFLNKYGSHLSPIESETIKSFRQLVDESKDVTQKMMQAIASVKSELRVLEGFKSECVLVPRITDFLKDFNRVTVNLPQPNLDSGTSAR